MQVLNFTVCYPRVDLGFLLVMKLLGLPDLHSDVTSFSTVVSEWSEVWLRTNTADCPLDLSVQKSSLLDLGFRVR